MAARRSSVRTFGEDRRKMPRFVEKYTDAQRLACAESMADHGRTAKRTAELAAAGELVYQGEPLESFEIKPSYVNDLKLDLIRRRTGRVKSELAAQPPRDAIEALRRRLVNAADSMMATFEKQVTAAVREGEVKPALVQLGKQVAGLILEASRLPGPSDRPPVAATVQKDAVTGERGVGTRGGPAGALIRAHRGGERVTPDAPDPGNDSTPPRAPNESGPDDAGPDPDDPAAFMAAQVERLRG